jgi:putative phage-type endonuclease
MTSFAFMSELEELENIIDKIEPTNEPSIFTEKNTLDLIETILHLMDNYIEENPTAISEPDFEEFFLDEIKEIIYIQFEDHFWCFDYVEETLDDLLEEALHIFFSTFYGERSLGLQNQQIETNNCYNEKNIITKKLELLRLKPQPDQRTMEWYQFRHNLLTASNAYKAFESQAMMNQLIYEKCQPIKQMEENKNAMVNVNTTLHWGQKYEPLSVLMYEYLYDTKIEDFGCIRHDKYHFLGASPDGINVDPISPLYGRMLEIKNIVNREITGIPKKEYWIQMQLQMEVWDLDECDFLETKFTEYENSIDFFNDGKEKTSKDEYKGVIMYFHKQDLKPFYVYKPIELTNYDDINKWEEEMVDKYQSNDFNMIWVKNCYWKLEKLSCVLVLRNQKWFQDNIHQLENIWKTIEKERITGYEHRAPNKKNKKETPVAKPAEDSYQGCLLTHKFTVKKLQEGQ